jgi:hypothetical protein
METNKGQIKMETRIIQGMEVQVIARGEWDIVTQEQREKNARKHNRATHGINPCHLCEQTISDKSLPTAWYVHMSTGAELLPIGVNITEGSQGYFPIGASCAKRIPKSHKTKLEGMF